MQSGEANSYESKQVAIEVPRVAFRVIGTCGSQEAQFVVFTWRNAQTSNVESARSKTVNNAFTMTGFLLKPWHGPCDYHFCGWEP